MGSNVDHRADLYAWGVVAYEVLAGTHPFARHATPRALFTAHLSEAPAPLAGRAPTVPPPLATLVTRCLAKDPAERPASAEAVLHALDAIHVRDDGGARGAAPPQRGSLARHRLAVAAVALLVLGGERAACLPSARVRRVRGRPPTGRALPRSRSCRSRTWAATRRSCTSPTV